MTAPTTFSPALRAELGKLDVAQILDLLGEIVEPSIYTPFDYDEDFQETLSPVTDAYRETYSRLVYAASGEGRINDDYAEQVAADFRSAIAL